MDKREEASLGIIEKDSSWNAGEKALRQRKEHRDKEIKALKEEIVRLNHLYFRAKWDLHQFMMDELKDEIKG